MNGMRFYLYTVLIFVLLSNFTVNAVGVKMRDPTQPAITDIAVSDVKNKEEAIYILKGIFISSPSQRVALINDTYVNEGDHIGIDEVKRIDKNSVVLSRPGQKRTIYLFK